MDQAKFTEEEMTSDPPLDKPKMTVIDCTAGSEEEKKARSQVWFEQNAQARVPLIALEADPYQIDGQAWACFSVIKPEEYGSLRHGEKEYHGQLIKFRGCFPTREKAEAHIHRLMKADKHFDIHLVPAFHWASLDDNDINDREYANEMVSEILKGYFKEENNRMMGIRRRMEATEDEDNKRSEEATEFFEASQRPVTRRRPLLAPGEQTKPITLDELAASLNIEPGGKTALHEEKLKREDIDAVVSTVLL